MIEDESERTIKRIMSGESYNVASTINGRRMISILDSNLVKALEKDDVNSIDSFIKSKGLSSELDDFLLQVIINRKLKLLEKLLSVGIDINANTIHGRPIIMAFYKGRVNHPVILFLMKYKIELNFKIMYDKIEANFLDLVVFLLSGDPILNLLIEAGAEVADKLYIPFGSNLNIHSYYVFIVEKIYSPNAVHSGMNVIDYLVNYDYRKYANLIAKIPIDIDHISIVTKILLICRLSREFNNRPMVLALLDSLPSELVINKDSLPTKHLEFQDFIAGMDIINGRSSENKMNVTIDTTYILTWFFGLPCDSNIIPQLLDSGVNLNDVSSKIEVDRDWQLALLQNGIGGGKSRSFIKLRTKKSGSKLIGENAKNINKYILTKEIITTYESYVRANRKNINDEERRSRKLSKRLSRGKSLTDGLSISDIKNMQVEVIPEDNSPRSPRKSDKSPRKGSGKKSSKSSDNQDDESYKDVSPSMLSELRSTLRLRGQGSK